MKVIPAIPCLIAIIGIARPARAERPAAPAQTCPTLSSELAARVVSKGNCVRRQCHWKLTGDEPADLRQFRELLEVLLDYLELVGARSRWPEPLPSAPLSRAIDAEQANLIISFSDVRSLQARYEYACRRHNPAEAASQYSVAVAGVLARLREALGRIAAASVVPSGSTVPSP